LEALLEIKKPDDTYEKELAFISKNAGIGGGSILIGNVVSYLSTILATRVIGAEDFGIFYLANTILLTTVLFSTLGLNQGVLRYISLYEARNDHRRIKGTVLFGIKLTLLLSVLITAVIFVASPFLANQIFAKPNLQVALRILIVALPFITVSEILLSGLQGLRLIALNALVRNIVQPLLRIGLLVLFFVFGLRLLGLLYANVISFVIGCALAYHYLNQKSGVFRSQTSAGYERSQLIRFSTPLFFEGILNHIIMFIPVLFLGYFRSSVEVGIYGIGIRLALLVSLPLASFNLIFAPTISKLYGQGDKKSLARLFKTVTKWIFTISFATSLVILIFAQPILSLFGENFTGGVTALYFIVIGELINAGVGSVGYMLMMTGRPNMNLLNSIILGAATVSLGFLLIPRYGIVGAALATSISVALLNFVRLFEVFYFERIHPYDKKFFKSILAGAISVIVFTLLKQVMPQPDWIAIIIFIFIFAFSMMMLRLEQEDKYIIKLFLNHLLQNGRKKKDTGSDVTWPTIHL
jgi:O-antigen/teichoic acid export membrane protein